MMPKVSVIIPAYNAEQTILETVESVLNQTFRDFEIIVIDDGSSDKTLRILETIQDLRVKVFSYENGGVAVARNRGISKASGDYVAFLDHDDLWTPDKIEAQLSCLEKHPNAGVAYSWTQFMRGEKGGHHFILGTPVMHRGNVYSELLKTNFLHSGSNLLARKEAIDAVGGFDPTPKNCEDWDYYLRLAAQYEFEVVPHYQILYRQSTSTLSGQIKTTEKGALILFEKAYAVVPALQHQKKESMANFYLYCADQYLLNMTQRSELWEPILVLMKAIETQPMMLTQLKLYVLLFRTLGHFLAPQLKAGQWGAEHPTVP